MQEKEYVALWLIVLTDPTSIVKFWLAFLGENRRACEGKRNTTYFSFP